MADFRNSRIGVRSASILLGITITELREAILSDKPIQGIMPPQPIFRSDRPKFEMIFLTRDVFDVKDKIKSKNTVS